MQSERRNTGSGQLARQQLEMVALDWIELMEGGDQGTKGLDLRNGRGIKHSISLRKKKWSLTILVVATTFLVKMLTAAFVAELGCNVRLLEVV